MNCTPIALTIAGSDSSGGAGIQADLKTMSALGVYGASVLSALTAQNTHGVSAIHDVPVEFITAQMQAVYSDLAVGATKIGMLSQSKIIEVVAQGLKTHSAKNIVLDPVMVATSGDLLLSKDAVDALKSVLIPIADIITPNLQEAAVLLNTVPATNRDELEKQAQQLLKLGASAVLLKGGHFDEPTADDLFVSATEKRWYSAPRIDTKNTHGTGCTLSSAIASGLAKGLSLESAIEQAKNYLSQAIAHADELTIGNGHGPVHHFFAVWDR
ncbi:MAG: bifunctional hydroxymethylpyrimidine kinase/phosphomethylpyrimidine kinase [Hyphomicrobiales bacterium]|nr:bifunctional hydroxymethylpyrimidine kinase/phosphomethylpyrimidine kinase [Hyphomicrobiales bacterium]PCJ94395.1 MAG: bifunctional hydroxymethylpyrimidine kinase/phosphomethylpyrimidine kinase [Hyphomicrobiales bacterium]